MRKAVAALVLLAIAELVACIQQEESPLDVSKVDYEVKTREVRLGGQLVVVFTVVNSGVLEHSYVLKCGDQVERFKLKGGEQKAIEFKLEVTGGDYSWELWGDSYLLAMGTITGYKIISTPASPPPPSPLTFLIMASTIAALLSASAILALLERSLREVQHKT